MVFGKLYQNFGEIGYHSSRLDRETSDTFGVCLRLGDRYGSDSLNLVCEHFALQQQSVTLFFALQPCPLNLTDSACQQIVEQILMSVTQVNTVPSYSCVWVGGGGGGVEVDGRVLLPTLDKRIVVLCCLT